MNRWILIDYDFGDKLPKEDCDGSLGYVSQAKDGCRRWISMQIRRILSMMGQLRG